MSSRLISLAMNWELQEFVFIKALFLVGELKLGRQTPMIRLICFMRVVSGHVGGSSSNQQHRFIINEITINPVALDRRR